MLDYKTLIKDVKKTIRSHSADELQEWIDSYYQRIALAEQEDDLIEPAAIPQKPIGKLNGTTRSEIIPIKKPAVAKIAKVRVMATADNW